jgi:hypothetical protein
MVAKIYTFTPPRMYWVIVALLHLSVILSLFLMPIFLTASVIGICLALVSLFWIFWRKRHHALSKIMLKDNPWLEIQTSSTPRWQPYEMLRGSVVTEFYLSFYLRNLETGKKKAWLLFPHQLDTKSDYRALSRWLHEYNAF